MHIFFFSLLLTLQASPRLNTINKTSTYQSPSDQETIPIIHHPLPRSSSHPFGSPTRVLASLSHNRNSRAPPPQLRQMIEMKVLTRGWNVWETPKFLPGNPCKAFANDEVLPASVPNWIVMSRFLGEPSWITTTNKIYSYQNFIFYWRKNIKVLIHHLPRFISTSFFLSFFFWEENEVYLYHQFSENAN
jgi:hypothetical protein